MKRLMKNFTLIELMIVVAIIAIIATIALPNLMSAQRNTRERSALTALRSVHTDQESFKNDNQIYGTLAQLADPAGQTPPMIGSKGVNLPNIASGTPKSGYYYEDIITAPTQDFYAVLATPSAFPSSGSKHYAITSVGKVRQDTTETTVFVFNATGAKETIDDIEELPEAK